MKKTLLIVLLLIVGCSKSVDFETITVRNNLAYLSQETKPYTGSIYKNSGEKEILKGTYKDGFKVGTWTYKTLTGSGIYDVYYNIGKVDSILFYESDNTSSLYIYNTIGYWNASLLAWELQSGSQINLRNEIKAQVVIANENSIFSSEIGSEINGSYFYQNNPTYNFFKHPDVYAQKNGNYLDGKYLQWKDGVLNILGNYKKGEKLGYWENRNYSPQDTSHSVVMLRAALSTNNGDTSFTEYVMIHRGQKPLTCIKYKGNRPSYVAGYWENSKLPAYQGGYTDGHRSKFAKVDDVGILSIHTAFTGYAPGVADYARDGSWEFFRPNLFMEKWASGVLAAGEKWMTWEYYDKDGNVVKTEECELYRSPIGSMLGAIYESKNCDEKIVSNDGTIEIYPVEKGNGHKQTTKNLENTDSFYYPKFWYGAYFE